MASQSRAGLNGGDRHGYGTPLRNEQTRWKKKSRAITARQVYDYRLVREIKRIACWLFMKKSLGTKAIHFMTPIAVIGSYDLQHRPNLMTAAWLGVCSSKPPAVTVSIRKATHTYHGLIENRAYTINIPSATYVVETDYFGIATGKTTDKFIDAGLTPVKSELVPAPYVKEFPLVLECRLLQTHAVGIHVQFVGEVLDIKAEESVMGPRRKLDFSKVNPIFLSPGTREYYSLGERLEKAFSVGKALQS